MPLLAALALFGAAGCFLFSLCPGAALVGICLRWLWQSGLREDPQQFDIGMGHRLLPHPARDQSPGWWGMVFTPIFDVTLLVSLLFGYVLLLSSAPDWPPPALIEPD